MNAFEVWPWLGEGEGCAVSLPDVIGLALCIFHPFALFLASLVEEVVLFLLVHLSDNALGRCLNIDINTTRLDR